MASLGGGGFIIEVQLICNAVPVSAVQQSDSVIHIHTFFFNIFFSITVCHRTLNIGPCAGQQGLVVYHPIYNSLHLLIPTSQSSASLHPRGNHKSVKSVSLKQLFYSAPVRHTLPMNVMQMNCMNLSKPSCSLSLYRNAAAQRDMSQAGGLA